MWLPKAGWEKGALKEGGQRYKHLVIKDNWVSLVAQTVKNPPAMWEAWLRSPGCEDPWEGGHGNPLQYSCLENPH